MRIRWVKAVAFGGLGDQKLTLRDGLNVIVGPNESGKSTWHAALFAALCGRSEELEATEDSEFDRRPWHASGWAVEAMLERDNDDPVLVYQDLLNPVSSTATELAGPQDGGRHDVSGPLRYRGGLDTAQWVGLDRHSYAATAWVQQGSGRNELSQAVALCIREEEAIRACERIDRMRRRHIGHEGDTDSPLGRAEAELVQCQAELMELRELHEQHSRAEAGFVQWSAFAHGKRQELVGAELAAAQQRVVQLQASIRNLTDDPFTKPYGETGGSDVANHEAHDAVVAAERELRAAEQALVAATVAVARQPVRAVARVDHRAEPERVAVAVAQVRSGMVEQPEVPAAVEYEPGTYDTRRQSRWRALRQPDGRALVVGILAVLVVAAGVGMAALLDSLALGATLAAIGVGLAVIAVWLGLRNPVRDVEVPVPPVIAPAREHPARLASPREPATSGPGPVEDGELEESTMELDDGRVRDARRQLAWALKSAGYPADMDTVDSVVTRYHHDRAERQQAEAERRARDEATMDGLRDKLNQAQHDVSAYSDQLDPNTPVRLGLTEPDQARTAWDHAARERDRAEHARDSTAAALANRNGVSSAEAAVERARHRRNSLRRIKDLLDEAYGYLSRSRVGARREIASALETLVGRSLPHITDGRYPHVTIGTDFRITISDPAEPAIDPMRGARSTREQTYLSARVALGEQLSRRWLYGPLLLDDVTSSADGPRVNGLLDLLYRFAQVRQVVVFAHEEAVADWAVRMMDSHHNVHLYRLAGPDQAPEPVPVDMVD